MDNLESLRSKLQRAWSRQTSEDPKHWSQSNPAWGQCAVTALFVHDILGGEIVKVKVPNYHETHYYNVLPSGEEVDLTEDEFDSEQPVFRDPENVSPEKLRQSFSKRYMELSLRMAVPDG
jgi:hypothetical protein